MAVTVEIKGKNKKKHVSSTYFDNIKDLKKSMKDTDWKSFYKDSKDFPAGKLDQENAITMIKWFKLGCREVSDYIESLHEEQLKDYVADYYGEDYDKA